MFLLQTTTSGDVGWAPRSVTLTPGSSPGCPSNLCPLKYEECSPAFQVLKSNRKEPNASLHQLSPTSALEKGKNPSTVQPMTDTPSFHALPPCMAIERSSTGKTRP
jgi:hypothetical protein